MKLEKFSFFNLRLSIQLNMLVRKKNSHCHWYTNHWLLIDENWTAVGHRIVNCLYFNVTSNTTVWLMSKN
jgi:hypothetical protein